MPARHRSNPLALAVLVCLAERPMHPYEAATTLRQRQKHESVRLNYGSLYAVVASLEKRKLIAPQETERKGRLPERTVYNLTGTGRIELHDWLTELLSTPVKDYTSFEAALSFLPALPPDDVATLLRERAGQLEREIAQAHASRELAEKQHVPRLAWVEEEYRTVLREAELGYVRTLAEQIATGTLEGIGWWKSIHGPEDHVAGRGTTLPGTTLPGATATRAPSSSPHGIRCVRAVSSINSRPGRTRTPASWRPGTSAAVRGEQGWGWTGRGRRG